MSQQIIAQGAEAIIILAKDKIQKNRIKKSYRINELDEKLRKSRTKSEAKLLQKAKDIAKINVPSVLKQDKFEINIEYIKGETLSKTLNNKPEKQQFEIIKQIAKQVAKLHENNIIHGDLTTSNMILVERGRLNEGNFRCPRVYLIDFGLGFISSRIEDKAVDLHLIKQALEAKHYKNHKKIFNQFLKAYKYPESKKVLEQLEKVEARGRYKH